MEFQPKGQTQESKWENWQLSLSGGLGSESRWLGFRIYRNMTLRDLHYANSHTVSILFMLPSWLRYLPDFPPDLEDGQQRLAL